MVRRLEPQQAPALDVPERLPARIERLGAELLVRADVPVVAAEPAVTQARTDLRVAGHEPALELLVAEHGRRLAKLREHGVRIGEEVGRGRVEVELDHGLLARADVLEQAVHAERDERRRRHAEADHAEHATGRRDSASSHSRSA